MSAAPSASALMPGSDEVFAAWSGRICELAACPNVHIFGFTHHTGELRRARRSWRPYLETFIAAFGPERAMFESHFPVDKGSCSYAPLRNAFKRIAPGYSGAEQAALFAGTATD
jgi:predicted TIM-barrel fold metal-dependent hydrolase